MLEKNTICSFSGQQQPKPKMSNSFELLQGSLAEIQQKYVQPLFSMDFL